ncbi:C2 domain-containing protein [Camellia lanceoleosa]|uniref:C2 domain-containing protein n=1 Tax=Camellia lanceoleosa TaxID=1840588 RepID=A0ACC0FXF8_9ERIC|nr:C2 domain-containing protein [Camellia lanceoleosa]
MATTKSKISNLLSILIATHITLSLASASYSNGAARKFGVDPFGGSGRSLSSSVAPLPCPRYDELWMPLISDLTVGSTSTHHPPMILPPIDIQWVWFCHTFNPVLYRQYCDSRFSKIMAKLFSTKRMKSALNRCRDIWIRRYPSEQFFVVHKRYVKRLRRKLRFEEKRNSNQRRVLSDSETVWWLNHTVEKIWPICME